MQKLNILNTREIKEIKELLERQFGYTDKLDYAFLLGENGKLFIVNRDIEKIPLQNLRVDRYGLYFGELKNKELRLSMEGAWLIGSKAKRNTLKLNEEEIRKYFVGENLTKDVGEENRFILLKFNEDIISCAKYKNGEILNFLPKIHRSRDLII
ncbi:MAG: hypothetical protein ABIA37_00245 [Candidatus Woesearchaeota archaeon]